MKWWQGLIVGLTVTGVAIVGSCVMCGKFLEEAEAPPKPPAPAGEAPRPVPTGVATIDIGWPTCENWDADPEVDGIEVDLSAKDAEDNTVQAPGVVSAKLWSEFPTFSGEKGALIQEWSDIKITKDDYDWFWGWVTIRLEYKGYTPQKDEWGILEVTLTTPDGRSFTARATTVMLTTG